MEQAAIAGATLPRGGAAAPVEVVALGGLHNEVDSAAAGAAENAAPAAIDEVAAGGAACAACLAQPPQGDKAGLGAEPAQAAVAAAVSADGARHDGPEVPSQALLQLGEVAGAGPGKPDASVTPAAKAVDEEEAHEADGGMFDMCLDEAPDAAEAPAGPDKIAAARAEDGGADGNTCAICLDQIPAPDLAIIKGCEHVYCVYCILQWADLKDTPWCPQCKAPFTYLYCHRQLDGTMSDFAIEESVTLLKRATWFQQHVKACEKGKQVCADDAVSPRQRGGQDWYQEFYEDFDERNEDDEIEDFFFSRAAGHARIVIANRRLGENGYMRSGRMYATPAAGGSSSHGKAKAKGQGKSGKAQLGHIFGSSPSAGGMLGSSPPSGGRCDASPSGAGSAGKPGRRAKRNAKRAAEDGMAAA